MNPRAPSLAFWLLRSGACLGEATAVSSVSFRPLCGEGKIEEMMREISQTPAMKIFT